MRMSSPALPTMRSAPCRRSSGRGRCRRAIGRCPTRRRGRCRCRRRTAGRSRARRRARSVDVDGAGDLDVVVAFFAAEDEAHLRRTARTRPSDSPLRVISYTPRVPVGFTRMLSSSLVPLTRTGDPVAARVPDVVAPREIRRHVMCAVAVAVYSPSLIVYVNWSAPEEVLVRDVDERAVGGVERERPVGRAARPRAVSASPSGRNRSDRHADVEGVVRSSVSSSATSRSRRWRPAGGWGRRHWRTPRCSAPAVAVAGDDRAGRLRGEGDGEVASPAASVVTVASPTNVSPSPNPDGSAGVGEDSTVRRCSACSTSVPVTTPRRRVGAADDRRVLEVVAADVAVAGVVGVGPSG